MNAIKITAMALVLVGVLILVYGGFTYTKETHRADFGPIQFTVKDKETVSVPVWVGVGAIVAGVLLLVVRTKN